MTKRTRWVWWRGGERFLSRNSRLRVLPGGTSDIGGIAGISQNPGRLRVFPRATSGIVGLKPSVWAFSAVSGFGKDWGRFRKKQWRVCARRVRSWGAFGGRDVDRLGCRTLGLRSAEGRGEGRLSKRFAVQTFQIDFALLSNRALRGGLVLQRCANNDRAIVEAYIVV